MSNCNINQNYSIDVNSNVPLHLRDNNPFTQINRNTVNGELYGGNESNKPWMPIKVTPTATNFIQRNLLSANPPPGATEQYVGTNRIGNNYTAMPNIHWFNPSSSTGPYHLKVTK